MKNLLKNKHTGTSLFYLLWPLIWIYAPLKLRVRVIIRHKDNFLVVKNWFGPNLWQFPGGGKKMGESVAETASREINEELGISLKDVDIKILTKEEVIVRQFGLKFRHYYVLYDLKTKPLLKLSSEISDVDWVKKDNIHMPKHISVSI